MPCGEPGAAPGAGERARPLEAIVPAALNACAKSGLTGQHVPLRSVMGRHAGRRRRPFPGARVPRQDVYPNWPYPGGYSQAKKRLARKPNTTAYPASTSSGATGGNPCSIEYWIACTAAPSGV